MGKNGNRQYTLRKLVAWAGAVFGFWTIGSQKRARACLLSITINNFFQQIDSSLHNKQQNFI